MQTIQIYWQYIWKVSNNPSKVNHLLSSLPTYCRLVNLLVDDPAKEIATSTAFADMVNQARMEWAALVDSFMLSLMEVTEKEEEKYFKVTGELLERVAQLGPAAAVQAFKFTPSSK